MADEITIDTTELRVLASDIAAAGFRAPAAVAQVIRDQAEQVAARAKASAPVLTGRTRASIGVTYQDAGMTAVIGPTTRYALFPEFGTARMSPRPFMGPALDAQAVPFAEALGRMAEGLLS